MNLVKEYKGPPRIWFNVFDKDGNCQGQGFGKILSTHLDKDSQVVHHVEIPPSEQVSKVTYRVLKDKDIYKRAN